MIVRHHGFYNTRGRHASRMRPAQTCFNSYHPAPEVSDLRESLLWRFAAPAASVLPERAA